MDEEFAQLQGDDWDAGFEGGRYIVVARCWPFTWVFQRPPDFRLRFWHQVLELAIRDWNVVLPALRLGSLCAIEASLHIRYQPSLRYTREHLEFLPDIHQQLESSLEASVRDIAEQEIRIMESDASWLEKGGGEIESAVERIVNEVLIMRGIHCRSRCRIEPHFAAVDEIDLDSLPPTLRYQAVYEEYMRRCRAAKERIIQEKTEQAVSSERLVLEREAKLQELAKQQEALRNTRRQHELECLRAELMAQESLHAQRQESERHRQEEQHRHEAQLRLMKAEAASRAHDAEMETLRAELAAVEARREEQRESEARLEEERLRLETRLRQMNAEAEMNAKEAHLEDLRKELAAEEVRQAEQRESEARRREEQMRHEMILRQLETKTELKNKEAELEILRTEMARVETQLEKQRECEARQREEQLRHEAHLRQIQTEAELREKERRTQDLDSLESYLNREIGLLAMERQRLLLEEEIGDIKQSRVRRWVANVKKRLTKDVSEAEEPAEAVEAQE
ncbi:MAG: hypothetical protein PHE55_06265 [Methylococcaceae bacterium]|nr:hypothetical protein [Methylococcaceae bacterium]